MFSSNVVEDTAEGGRNKLGMGFGAIFALSMLAAVYLLTNKLAALYAQHLPDPVIIDAVNDIEDLTTNLCNKIWQKITILDTGRAL